MSPTALRIALTFGPEDQAWIRQSKAVIPAFWQGHQVAPAQGDVVRIAGRQFVIQARVWEHDGDSPVLKLFVGHAHAHSDTVFG